MTDEPRMPVPHEELSAAELDAMERYLAAPVASSARPSPQVSAEEGLPVEPHVWHAGMSA